VRRDGVFRELTALVQKTFQFPENSLEMYAEKFNIAVFLLSHNVKVCDTNFSAVSQSEGGHHRSPDPLLC